MKIQNIIKKAVLASAVALQMIAVKAETGILGVETTNGVTATVTTAPASVASFLTSPIVIVIGLIIIIAIIAILFFTKPKAV